MKIFGMSLYCVLCFLMVMACGERKGDEVPEGEKAPAAKTYVVEGEFSEVEEEAIVRMVSEESRDFPILEIFRIDESSAEVLTGHDDGPMSGVGMIFELKLAGGKWYIQRQYNWEK